MRTFTDSLDRVFDPRDNALNAWRLVLAPTVILWHSWPLTGHALPNRMAVELLASVPVDAFFAISGFLITWSWMRNPNLRQYFTARCLRIFPGLWVCVIIIAFVIAPISILIQGSSVNGSLTMGSRATFILANGLLFPFYVGIDGTPRDIPWPGVWDGSLWTLTFEMGCYIAVAVLGVAGLLKPRWTIPTIFVLSLCATAILGYPAFAMQTIPQMIARFSVMFAAGAFVYQYRGSIPARWSLVAVSAGIVLASGMTSNYRVLAAIPLAYLVIASGVLVKGVNLRNDLSYGVYIYAFPIQQLLIVAGLGSMNLFLFFVVSTVATLPLAAVSWFIVEKKSLALKKRLKAPAARTQDV